VEARTPPSRLEEIAYINTLREAFERGSVDPCYRGDPTYFRGELSQGYPTHTPAQEGVGETHCLTFRASATQEHIRRYLEAGFGLSDIYCQRFFIVASQSALRRRFERNVGTTVDSLVGTVLSLANAGETAIGIVNAGFGAVDSTFQNMDESFLVAPDLENVRALGHAAQDDYRRVTFEERMPESFPSARSAIERYAGICSFTGMRRLVNISVADQARQLDDQTQGEQQQPTQQASQPTVTSQPAAETRPAAAVSPPPTP